MTFTKIIHTLVLTVFISLSINSQGFNDISSGVCGFSPYQCTPSSFSSTNFRVFQNADFGCFTNNVLVINNINWFYFETSGSGTLNLNLNSSGNNVDYVCWGPFTSPRTACINELQTNLQAPVSCGAGSGNETINLTGVTNGEFYLVLTRSSVAGATINFSKASGSASVSCSNSSRCGDVDYDATELSYNGTNIGDSQTYPCGTNRRVYFKAHPYSQARESITPAMISYTIMNQRTSGNYITPIGVGFFSCSPVLAFSQPGLTMHFVFQNEYMSPSQPNQLGYQYCDTYSGASSENMPYNIYDIASGNSITSGTWNVTASGTGPNCGSDAGGTDCQNILFSANNITGSASYTCTSCAGALTTFDNGRGYIDIGSLPVGTHNIVYNWNNNNGCSGSKTKTITITGSGDPTFNYSHNMYCNGQANPSPTEASTSGTYSSTPSGLSINSNNGNINISSSTSGTYTVTKTIGSGTCAATHTQTITIGGGNANAGSNKTINCSTNSVTLDGSGGGSYSWSPATGLSSTTIATPIATPSTTTTYTLTTTSGGCTATDQVTVNVNTTAPTANAGANQSVTCASPSTTLNGSGGSSFSWSPTTGLSSTTIATPTATPSSTTTYTLTVTGSNGCTDTDQVTVTVNGTLPSVNAGSNSTINCSTTSATLNGSGTGTYLWTPSTGLSSPTIANPVASPNTTTTYTLTVTASNGCTNTDQTTITVNQTPPNANAGSDITLDCNTTSSSFTASGGTAYSWSTPNGTFSGQTLTVSDTDTPGNYTVTVTGNNGCTQTNTAILTIDQTTPSANAGSPQTYSCGTNSLSLDGTNSSGTNISYLWSGPNISSGANTSSPTISSAGTYLLTVTGSNGCTDTDQVIITPDLNIPLANAGADININCINQSVNLDGSNSDTGSNITYNWTTSDGNLVGNTNTISANADLDGTYTLTVTNTSNNCSASDNIIVLQDTITPVVNFIEDTLYLTCLVPTVILNASNSSGTNNTFNWTTTNGTIDSGENTDAPTVSSYGQYNVTVTSENGCSNIISPTIVVLMDTTSPSISLIQPDTLNCNLLSVTINASNTTNATSYQWTTIDGNILNGANSNTAEINQAGTYSFTATADNGCFTTQEVICYTQLQPIANIDATPINGETPLDVNFDGSNSIGLDISYNWEYLTNNISNNVNFPYLFEEVGEHIITLIITDQFGCKDSSDVIITVEEVSEIFIPNVFTPNGDNTNDNFEIKNIDIYPENTLIIFNRWGDKVFEASPYLNDWDGKNKIGGIKPIGEDLVEGTYFYILYLEPGQKGLNGTVELIKD